MLPLRVDTAILRHVASAKIIDTDFPVNQACPCVLQVPTKFPYLHIWL
jgi:hypothetical protein